MSEAAAKYWASRCRQGTPPAVGSPCAALLWAMDEIEKLREQRETETSVMTEEETRRGPVGGVPEGAVDAEIDRTRGGDAELYAFPCKFGWNVPGAQSNTRLYALDAGPAPRWAKPPRSIEHAVENVMGPPEGMHAVVVVVGDERIRDEVLERCRAAAAAAVLKVLTERTRA